jgi:hypothetical protein
MVRSFVCRWILVAAMFLTWPGLVKAQEHAVLGTIKVGDTTIVFQRGSVGPIINELRAFDEVVAQEPSLEVALARNPKLVNDDSFVAKHPALGSLLQRFPGARDDIVANPGDFVPPLPSSSWNKPAPEV